MRILSLRTGFQADHSSTSYVFYAIDRPLTRQQQAKVASLSRRCHPTHRKVEFIYNVDGYDIPGGWEALMVNYYDVMVRQDYDWYTLCMAFKYSKKLETELSPYICHGEDDLGLDIECHGSRLLVIIHTCIDYGVDIGIDESDFLFGGKEQEEDDEADDYYNGYGNGGFSDEGMALLLTKIRADVLEGDNRGLYIVWEKFHTDWDEDEEDKPAKKSKRPIPPAGIKHVPSYLRAFKAALITTNER